MIVDNQSKQLDVATKKKRDRAFLARMEDAIRRYRIAWRARREANPETDMSVYDDGQVSVRSVFIENSPEVGYGIHFIDTDEYALQTIFVDGDRDKRYVSNYRSDMMFKERGHLER